MRWSGPGRRVPTLFVAQQLGYFDEQNLDVQVTTFQSASQMIPLLATAKLDAGNGGSSPAFFNAFSSGIPLKIVSDVTVVKRPDPNVHSAQQIVVRKQLYDQGVKTLADLKGHSIAINTPGSLNQEQLEDSLRTVGLTPDDVQLQTVGFNDMLTAVTNGGVDAAVALEPFVTLGQRQNIWVPVFDVADATLGQTAEWLIYGDDFLKKSRLKPGGD
jgi:NitT/TauT family transport system substrate-binding protein